MTPLRLAADVVSTALGVNVWLSLVLVPSIFAGAFTRHPTLLAVAPLPLVALGAGVTKRSPVWLLLAFPASLLLPVAIDPRIAAEGQAGRLALLISAASFVGFLFGAAYLTSYAASQPPAGRRTLARSLAARQPSRWRRRRRMYIAFTVLSAIFPAALLYNLVFSSRTREYLVKLYPEERAPAMMALILVGILGLWMALLGHAIVDPLRRHRTGDRELVHELARLRHDARHGAPRLSFYVGVIMALALMAVILAMKLG